MRIMTAILMLCSVLGTSAAETGSRQAKISVLAQPSSGSSVLRLQFRLAHESVPPDRLSILGRNQSLIPSVFSHNGVLGKIKVETAEHGTLLLVMHSLVHSGANRWSFKVSSEDGMGSLPVARGELSHTSMGFRLELVATEWLTDLGQQFALPAVVDTEFEFAVPIAQGSAGDLSYSVSISGSIGSNGGTAAR